MSHRCVRCDEEITYSVGYEDFVNGLFCDHCQRRYDKFDDYRVWREHQKRRVSYLERWSREFIDKKVDELLGE